MVRTWEQAWGEALYGDAGFYRRPEGPAGHFGTSAQGPTGELFAEALLELAHREGLTTIIDVACGRGELLASLASRAADDLTLVGVDIVPRPADLDARIEWRCSPGGAALPDLGRPRDALVLAHEWLDVVPCPVACADDEGLLRTVLVDDDGTEQLGDPLVSQDLAWATRWWPGPHAPGDRVEIGSTRDEAFADLVDRVASGVVLAVDYGHTLDRRPTNGTLIAYADGSACPPTPDGCCDLTAHVAMDSLRADSLRTQRDSLRDLGLDGARPPIETARVDPAGYLAALSRASRAAALSGPGPGDFLWASSRVR